MKITTNLLDVDVPCRGSGKNNVAVATYVINEHSSTTIEVRDTDVPACNTHKYMVLTDRQTLTLTGLTDGSSTVETRDTSKTTERTIGTVTVIDRFFAWPGTTPTGDTKLKTAVSSRTIIRLTKMDGTGTYIIWKQTTTTDSSTICKLVRYCNRVNETRVSDTLTVIETFEQDGTFSIPLGKK